MNTPHNLGDVFYDILSRTAPPPTGKGSKYYKIDDCKFCGSTRKIIGQDKKEINCPRCVRARPPRDVCEYFIVKRNITNIQMFVGYETTVGYNHRVELSGDYGSYHYRASSRRLPFANIDIPGLRLYWKYDGRDEANICWTEADAIAELKRRELVYGPGNGYYPNGYCYVIEDQTLPPEALRKVIAFGNPI